MPSRHGRTGYAVRQRQGIEGVFDTDQKRDIVERLTETIVGIAGENMREVTWVVVEEVRSGEWGIGGKALSTVKALAAGDGRVVRSGRPVA